MSRDYLLYLEDIQLALERIDRYVLGLSFETFSADEMRVDAVVRNLETVGEAVKHLPEDIRAMSPDTPWKQIAGLRDVLTHAYFSVNLTLLWDIITNEAPALRSEAKRLIAQLESAAADEGDPTPMP